MESIAAWVAPIATMIAAVMTAANLGARVTGWGFVVFTLGSIAWSIVAISTGQQNLLWTNGFLTLVNGIGIWRWLGRQARYDEGGAAATQRSAAIARLPTLFAAGSMAGAKLMGRDGAQIGTVIEAMMRCSDSRLSYVVVSEGGVGGIGERLHALAPGEIVFAQGLATCRLSAEQLADRPVLPADDWPATLDCEHG
ncbi:MAG: PRC-barrel domain-containing protein [Sphingobium sp.]|nr:PRC-barrel domain-containing protein [Sphingobium sp.]